MVALGNMEAKILQHVEDKIQDDENWASDVRRNVNEKLLHVKDDFDDIKSSIEDAKTRMKEQRHSSNIRKTKKLEGIM